MSISYIKKQVATRFKSIVSSTKQLKEIMPNFNINGLNKSDKKTIDNVFDARKLKMGAVLQNIKIGKATVVDLNNEKDDSFAQLARIKKPENNKNKSFNDYVDTKINELNKFSEDLIKSLDSPKNNYTAQMHH
jgi:ABC-type lipoprotein release transport system permease subunit